MPGPPSPSRRTRKASQFDPSSRPNRRTLSVVDNRPLQRAAWAELHAARKRLDKVSRDLHRHEEIDVPAYDSWLHRTFPVFVTTLRQLHQEIVLKGYQVDLVQAMNYATGRSLKKLWRELKEREANPEAFKDEPPPMETPDEDEEIDWDTLDDDEDDVPLPRGSTKSSSRQAVDPEVSRRPADHNRPAKEIYRRLVQRLHPDRGGEWTPARERLWHQVQQAWTSGDIDCLARLEVEWEAANEVLSETSPLGRLRRAIEELECARRDIERKLREYRGSYPWRFTLSEKSRQVLHRRTEENFRHDLQFLQRQLDHLNATIAAWERTSGSARRRQPTRKTGRSERINQARDRR